MNRAISLHFFSLSQPRVLCVFVLGASHIARVHVGCVVKI